MLYTIRSSGVELEHIKILGNNLIVSISTKLIIITHHLTNGFILSQCLFLGFSPSPIDLVHLLFTLSPLLKSTFQSFFICKIPHSWWCDCFSPSLGMAIFIRVILSNSLERVHAFLVDILDTYLQLLPDDLLLPLFLIKVSLYGSFLRIPKGDQSVQPRTKVSIRVVATKFKWI